MFDHVSFAGFCDQSHLTRVFKAITGMTPVPYRQVALGSSQSRTS